MPQIAVKAPANLPAGMPPTAGKFSSALSEAAGKLPDDSSPQKPTGKPGSKGSDTAPADSPKNGGKASSKSGRSEREALVAAQANEQNTLIQNEDHILLPLQTNPVVLLAAVTTTSDSSSISETTNAEVSATDAAITLAKPTPLPVANLVTAVQDGSPSQDDGFLEARSARAASIAVGPDSAKTAAPASTSKAKASVEIDKTSVPARTAQGNATKSAAPDNPAADLKSDSRPAETEPTRKAIPAPTSPDHRASSTDVRLVAVASPAIQPSNMKAGQAPSAQTAKSATKDASAGVLLQSSQNDRKDGAPSNTSKQSGKNESPSELAGALSKKNIFEVSPQANGSAASSSTGSNQVSQLVNGGVAGNTNLVSRTGDPAVKNVPHTGNVVEAEAAAENAALHAGSPLQVAKLVERVGQTELRVGLQAGEFGNVDIRTSMAHSQFTAQVSVERSELGRALTAELPALHDRLAEQRVPMANVVLHDHTGGSGGGHFRQGTQQDHAASPTYASRADDAESHVPLVAVEVSPSSGLDVHM